MNMRVYVASSWRNQRQPEVVQALSDYQHKVYDFRNPTESVGGFHWSDIDPKWKDWTPREFRGSLNHPVARGGLMRDWGAMRWADVCVLVMPCGRSAHLEAGWFVGAGKKLLILLSDGEPELMYGLASGLCLSVAELVERVNEMQRGEATERRRGASASRRQRGETR